MSWENFCTSGVTMGKSRFLIVWVLKWLAWWIKWQLDLKSFLMSYHELNLELRKTSKTFSAPALYIFAPSFNTFWPVLGELTFDRSNKLKSEKKRYICKLDRIRFPISYHALNLELRKASNSCLHQHYAFLHHHSTLFDQSWENQILIGKIKCN